MVFLLFPILRCNCNSICLINNYHGTNFLLGLLCTALHFGLILDILGQNFAGWVCNNAYICRTHVIWYFCLIVIMIKEDPPFSRKVCIRLNLHGFNIYCVVYDRNYRSFSEILYSYHSYCNWVLFYLSLDRNAYALLLLRSTSGEWKKMMYI